MPTINNVTLCGHATRTPEMRTTPSGKSVCNFAIGLKTGKDRTSFIEITCWEKTAEIAVESIVKGCLVAVEGSLAQDTYEKDGEKRSKTYVNAHRVHFMRLAGEGQRKDAESVMQERVARNLNTPKSEAEDVDEDSIPF